MSAGEPTSVWNLEASLGEGPVWVERDRALWFVDINRHKVHRYDPADGDQRSWDAPEPVGFVFPAKRGGFVAGLASGLFHFDETSGTFDRIVAVEADKPDNRLNDGAVDPAGRLWFGTMDKNEKAKSGAFYCFADGELRPTELTGIAITNGPALSPDGRLLYFVDTLGGKIGKVEVRGDGTLGEPQPFARIAPNEGHPDGPTIDRDGCLWVALYGGWEARRYSPAGEANGRIRFPAGNITKIAFGGEDLRILFATSARQRLSPEQIEKQPRAGDLFECPADVAGAPCPLVAW